MFWSEWNMSEFFWNVFRKTETGFLNWVKFFVNLFFEIVEVNTVFGAV